MKNRNNEKKVVSKKNGILRKAKYIFMCAMLGIEMTVLAGCGSEKSSSGNDAGQSTDNSDVSDSKESKTSEGYLFKSNGVTIGVDMDMAPIAEALGEPKSIYEQPSCAAQGTAYLYTYSGFEINTYPDGDTNYIAYILLKDDTVSTPEGVDLSKVKEDIINAYGDNYTEDDNKITYTRGNMKLNFILDGDNIVSIEYDSNVLN